jgi:hypothetical protein
MKLTQNEIQAILLAAFAILVVTVAIIQHRHDSKDVIITSIREEVFMLFLFAEKQDWVNEEKMQWVVHTFYEKFPDIVKEVIKESTVDDYVEQLYKDFKQYLQDGKLSDFVFDTNTNTGQAPDSTEQK